MFPDNNTPGVLTMLNSQSLVDKFVEEAGKTEIKKEDIVCHVVLIGEEEEMDTEVGII